MSERAPAEQVRSVSSDEAAVGRTDRPAAVPIRVVIVDDHALLREGTIQLLEQQAEVEVVGQAGSGEEGLEVLRRLRPDVALVDVHLPGMSGLALARAAAASIPGVRVLIVSAYDDYAYMAEALEIGVGGYLLKTASARELVDAVRAVADGVFVLDQALSSRLTRRRRSGPLAAGLAAGTLTRRESEVLGVLARGRSNQQIAAELGLGQRTVEGHVSSVLGKLGVASRAEAVAYALGHRIVMPQDYDDPRDTG
jgi:DNA-binding NarL/FixJ family response regulator